MVAWHLAWMMSMENMEDMVLIKYFAYSGQLKAIIQLIGCASFQILGTFKGSVILPINSSMRLSQG